MSRYTVTVTREGGNWLGEVADLPGAHAYARTLARLRTEMTDAIVLAADLADGADVEVDLDPHDVPAEVAAALRMAALRQKVQAQVEQLTTGTRSAARDLIAAGWSVRDAAGALDITPGRVSQLIGAREDHRSTSARRA